VHAHDREIAGRFSRTDMEVKLEEVRPVRRLLLGNVHANAAAAVTHRTLVGSGR